MKTKTTPAARSARASRGGRALSVPRLKKAMRAAGVTQNVLQGALVAAGVGGRLSDWLSGRCNPSVPALVVLARTLGVSMEDLIRA